MGQTRIARGGGQASLSEKYHRGTQIGLCVRFTGKKHRGGFEAPSHFVVGMNLLVPAHGILEPFTLGKSQRRFDLGTYAGLADSLVQLGHEHDSGDLLDQGGVFRLHNQQRGFGGRRRFRRIREIRIRAEIEQLLIQENFGEFLKCLFCLQQIAGRRIGVNHVRVFAPGRRMCEEIRYHFPPLELSEHLTNQWIRQSEIVLPRDVESVFRLSVNPID